MSVHSSIDWRLRHDACPDAGRAASLHAAIFPESWTEEEFRGLFSSPAAALFWWGSGQQTIGLVLLNIVLDEAEILTLGVHPHHRRAGHARRMLDALSHELSTRPIRQLLLEVDTHNQPALKLYARSGFETISIRKAYYAHADQPPTDAWVMRKSLQSSTQL